MLLPELINILGYIIFTLCFIKYFRFRTSRIFHNSFHLFSHCSLVAEKVANVEQLQILMKSIFCHVQILYSKLLLRTLIYFDLRFI